MRLCACLCLLTNRREIGRTEENYTHPHMLTYIRGERRSWKNIPDFAEKAKNSKQNEKYRSIEFKWYPLLLLLRPPWLRLIWLVGSRCSSTILVIIIDPLVATFLSYIYVKRVSWKCCKEKMMESEDTEQAIRAKNGAHDRSIKGKRRRTRQIDRTESSRIFTWEFA